MGISLGYLEEIAMALKKAELIEGRKGPGGGYRLTRSPESVTAEMIFVAIEGPVHLVDCQKNKIECPAQGKCRSQGFWILMQNTILTTLRQTTLEQILHL
jgi:Rrf2 family protein